ncbi:helix-turn-helix transcriptional regulator [uncultured Aureimonas sp.]|uniref:LexA family transcriptional regulator n=1 Tax=uncultured Aureimonas sp. TaxID=1604662 RepID=UPI0025E33EF7|nr:helix-turn-helix transcriptional regulator [uncultured Aureimonas sp.]
MNPLQSSVGTVSEFKDRLQELVSERRSANAFASEVGIGQTLLRQYLKGATPGLDKVVQIAKATGIHINWLATGEGPRDSSDQLLQIGVRTQPEQTGTPAVIHVPTPDMPDDAIVLIPLMDVQPSAGSGTIVEAEPVLGRVAFDAAWLRARSITPTAAKVLTARGDSMEPTIRSGDTLIVDTAIDQAVDNGIYVLVYGEALLVKRLRIRLDSTVVITSDNQAAGFDEIVTPDRIDLLRIAGRVMWYGRMI